MSYEDKEELENKILDGMARHYLKMGYTNQRMINELRLALSGKKNYVGWGYKDNKKVRINIKLNPRSDEYINKLIARMSVVWKAFLAAQKKS